MKTKILFNLSFLFILTACGNDNGQSEENKKLANNTSQIESTSVQAVDTVLSPTEPFLLWETPGFINPESVIYDEKRERYYVSNVNGSPIDKDGKGTISTVTLNGEMIEEAWIIGLDSPKGLTLYNNKLYVADVDTLIEIDIESRIITNTYQDSTAKMLNDVTVTSDGIIYVSDMLTNRIYSLKDDHLEIWLESNELENPNGLHATEKELIVGAWGVMAEDFSTEVPGHLKTVNYNDKTIKPLGSGTPVGNLDGIESDGKGNYFVTDWMAGKLMLITPEGESTVLLELTQGMADHEVILDSNVVLLPMMKDNKLLAYDINSLNKN